MRSCNLKKETAPLLKFIELLGEVEWCKCVNSQYLVKKLGEWVVEDQSEFPPKVSFRFRHEDPSVICRLRAAIDGYKGALAWECNGHQRDGLPGTNWTIAPRRFWEVSEVARELGLAPGQYLARYEPELGPTAYADISGLTLHVQSVFSEV